MQCLQARYPLPYITAVCSKVQILREVWEVKREDLTTKDVKKMKAVSSFMEKVEILIQPNDGYPPCSKEGRRMEEVENGRDGE